MTRLRTGFHYAGIKCLVGASWGSWRLCCTSGRRCLVTETDIIETYASRYLSEAGEGAARTDCRAVPGQGDAPG